jgi:hypothetical protein
LRRGKGDEILISHLFSLMSTLSLRSKWPLALVGAFLSLALSGSAETSFTPVDLGTINIGAAPASSTLTFSLSGLSARPVFSLQYGGEFTIGTATCDGGFASCTLPVTFTPKYPGIRHDLVVVRDDTNNLIGRMALSGTGKGPQASVSPGLSTPLTSLSASGYPPPSFYAFDPAGNVYTTGISSNLVFKIRATDQSVTVIAGSSNLPAGYSGDGGLATNAQLNAPASLALDNAGNLYIADSGNNVIRKIDTLTGIISTAVGNGVQGHTDSGPATSAELTRPFRLVLDPAGNLYFLERGDSEVSDYKIREVDAATQTLTIFAGTGVQGYSGDNGPATAANIGPLALGADANGNVYFVQQSGENTEAGGIVRVIAGGIVSTFAGSTSGQTGDGAAALSTAFSDIKDISVDAAGDVYFIDGFATSSAVRRLGSVGPHIVSTIFPANFFYYPYSLNSLGMDPVGNLYTSDNASSAVFTSTQGAPLNFPSTNTAQTSSALQLVYYNTGNDTLSTSGISIAGEN